METLSSSPVVIKLSHTDAEASKFQILDDEMVEVDVVPSMFSFLLFYYNYYHTYTSRQIIDISIIHELGFFLFYYYYLYIYHHSNTANNTCNNCTKNDNLIKRILQKRQKRRRSATEGQSSDGDM